MWSTTKLQFGLIILLVIVCISPFIATPATATTAQLEILSVDSAQHPTLRTTVVVRDLYGQGVANLGAGNFVIEEGDQTIPGELIQIQPLDSAPQPLTVAIVADISVFLGDDELRNIREDIQSFVEELIDTSNTSIEVGLFVPSDGRSDVESTHTVPFTTEGAPVIDALTDIKPHEAETPLYNTIVTTINTAANRAEQRGGPAYVVVFGDGIDRTSIVGGGTSGANEAAQIAETRHVQVNAFGYGQSLEEGSGALRQLTGRTNGLYQSTPTTRQLTDFAEQLQGFTTKGMYELSYASTLPADGAEHGIAIHANVGTLRLSSSTQVLIAREWDHTVPANIDVQFDMQAYPDITMLARPLNQLRQTVPDLTSQDFTLSLDGEPLDAALDVTNVPLDANDPAASQSVAFVVDQAGPSAEDIHHTATALLQEPALSDSRVSLFVPGVPNETPEFTHDHNALINTLRQIPVDASAQSSANATLQRAIDEVAQDGTSAQRPAAVILISDRMLSPEERARTLTIARDLGVIIHTITLNTNTTPAPTYLAEATTGLHLSNPQPADLTEFATQITEYEASTYRLTFQMPLLEEQRAYNLEVQVADLSAAEEVMPVVQGNMDVRSPLPIYAQVLLFITLASVLTASAFAPTYVNNRRNVCPKCQRVRRKDWGNTCLFCEQQTAKKQSQSSNEIPLTGFAFQGAGLIQPDGSDDLNLDSTPRSEPNQTGNGASPSQHPDAADDDIFSGKDDVGLGGFALQGASLIQPGFADNVDLNSISPSDDYEEDDSVEVQPEHPEINQSEKPADKLVARSENFIRRIFGDDSASLPPTQDDQFDQDQDTIVPTINNHDDSATESKIPDPIDQARSQTHTDFWGSLPDEQAAVQKPITQDEPESPTTQPPPLPMFRNHQKQVDTPKLRPQVPQEVQEPTHTDFWGPLPTDGGQETWQEEPTQSTSVKESTTLQPAHNKSAQTNDQEAITQTEEHTPSSHQSTEVSKATHKQVPSQEELPAQDEHQESHTDFWGPLG
ncbi:MAG: hypothetical protein AAGF95_24220 [Chloroflexota bacterium]